MQLLHISAALHITTICEAQAVYSIHHWGTATTFCLDIDTIGSTHCPFEGVGGGQQILTDGVVTLTRLGGIY